MRFRPDTPHPLDGTSLDRLFSAPGRIRRVIPLRPSVRPWRIAR